MSNLFERAKLALQKKREKVAREKAEALEADHIDREEMLQKAIEKVALLLGVAPRDFEIVDLHNNIIQYQELEMILSIPVPRSVGPHRIDDGSIAFAIQINGHWSGYEDTLAGLGRLLEEQEEAHDEQ